MSVACLRAFQVDSLSVNPGPEGLPELMVSQPGCGYAILLCSWTQQDSPAAGDEDSPAPSGRYQNSAEITPSCRQSGHVYGFSVRGLHEMSFFISPPGGSTTRTFRHISSGASAKVKLGFFDEYHNRH